MDRPFVQGQEGNAVDLEIDRKYETKLNETYGGKTLDPGALVFPFGLGLRYKFGRKFHADISATYYWSLSDQIDAYENKKQTDHFLYTSVGFAYHIAAKKQKPDSTQFDSFDFVALDQADDDGDGVINLEDVCSNTPSGAAVDASGCPLDSDNDGVPDYRDAETSADSALVDANGVTIDPDFIVLPDTNAVAHNIIYEAYPSMEFPKVGNYYSFEKPKEEETKKELGDFSAVDQNGDGFISADEITWAIDAFFEGELDFSAAKLHDLIDFFFDQ
jgi:Ca2+-binding EF-hand superfamily protein